MNLASWKSSSEQELYSSLVEIFELEILEYTGLFRDSTPLEIKIGDFHT
jgi:hypothetical protein